MDVPFATHFYKKNFQYSKKNQIQFYEFLIRAFLNGSSVSRLLAIEENQNPSVTITNDEISFKKITK
jgi:hypothetical protein